MRATRAAVRVLLTIVPLVFFALFFAYPVASIIGLGIREGGQWHFAAFAEVLGDRHIQRVLWFTVWQAALSTVLTLLIALPGAYVFARMRFKGKAVLRALVTVPFVLPTVVVGAAFLGFLGQSGISDDLFGVEFSDSTIGILAAHVFFNYAVVVRIVGGLWTHLDPQQTAAARVLGASGWSTFWRVTYPALRPALLAAALIVFLFTFSSFGVIQILGGPSYATLEVEIYRQTAQLLQLPTAAVLSLIQLLAIVAMLVAHSWVTKHRDNALKLVPAEYAARPPATLGAKLFLLTNLLVIAAVLFVPLGVLVQRSLKVGNGYGVGHYRELFQTDYDSTLIVPAAEAISNSLQFAIAATIIAVAVGGCAAVVATLSPGRFTRFFDAALMLPLGVSAVTVGFGFLIALDTPPLDLRASPLLIPLAQALVAIPFVVRTLVPVLRSIDPRLREAAAVLGASPPRVWQRIDLALSWRAGMVAAGFAFAVSLGEFGATVFIARGDTPTVPVAIFRLLGRPGETNYGQAMALSVILMVLCAGALLALERIRLPKSVEL